MSSLSVPGFIWYHGVLHPSLRKVIAGAHRTMCDHKRGGSPAAVYHPGKELFQGLLDYFSVGVEVMNVEDFPEGPAIVTANHSSTLDIPVLLSLPGEHYFAAKESLFSYPLFGGAMRAVGMPRIERGSLQGIESLVQGARLIKQYAAEHADSNPYLDVFVEGTRNHGQEGLQKFKKGAFIASLKEQLPIVPVVIHGAQELMPKDAYRVKPGKVVLYVLPAMPLEDYSLPEEVRTKGVRDFLDDALVKEALSDVLFETRARMLSGLEDVRAYARPT